jgi:hypothetical protein
MLLFIGLWSIATLGEVLKKLGIVFGVPVSLDEHSNTKVCQHQWKYMGELLTGRYECVFCGSKK